MRVGLTIVLIPDTNTRSVIDIFQLVLNRLAGFILESLHHNPAPAPATGAERRVVRVRILVLGELKREACSSRNPDQEKRLSVMKAGGVLRAGTVVWWLSGAMAENIPSAPTPTMPTTDGAWVEYPETNAPTVTPTPPPTSLGPTVSPTTSPPTASPTPVCDGCCGRIGTVHFPRARFDRYQTLPTYRNRTVVAT